MILHFARTRPARPGINADVGMSLKSLASVLILNIPRLMTAKRLFALDGGGYRMSSRIFWSVAGAYYFTSFVKTDMHFELWSENERLMTAILAVCLTIIFSLFAEHNK
jgi:hypothetical protein